MLKISVDLLNNIFNIIEKTPVTYMFRNSQIPRLTKSPISSNAKNRSYSSCSPDGAISEYGQSLPTNSEFKKYIVFVIEKY